MTVLEKHGVAVGSAEAVLITDREDGTIRIYVTGPQMVILSSDEARFLARMLTEAAHRADNRTNVSAEGKK